MIDRKIRRKINKVMYKNLDGIYKAAKIIAKAWDQPKVPLEILKTIIESHKPDATKGTEHTKKFNTQYNKVLDSLLLTCKNQAKAMDSESIPLLILKSNLNKIKESFKISNNELD